MTFLNINIDQLPDSEDMSPVPAGVYQVVIDGAELKATRAGTGQYINLKLKVQGGEYNNRVIFDIINISNPSAAAQNIGLASLKKIMKAMRLQSVQDTDQLIGGNLVVKVSIEDSDQYGEQNRIKDYQSAGGNIATPAINNVAAMSMGQVAQPAPPAPLQQPVQQPSFEDDLPF